MEEPEIALGIAQLFFQEAGALECMVDVGSQDKIIFPGQKF